MATRQEGVIDRLQLLDCGVSDSAIPRWVASGRLHVRYPGVYTVGHESLSVTGELLAALMAAGRESVLSHATAAWWWGLTEKQPSVIELSVPQASRPRVDGVRIHRPRELETTRYRRLLVTPLPRTFVDYASGHSVFEVKRALAEAEYRHGFDLELLRPAAARGRPGSARLRKAVKRHQPELAHTRSWLEATFLVLCQEIGLPTPQTNRYLDGFLIDAMWPDRRLAVELDGHDGHRTPAQQERDRDRELMLRRHGFVVLRYTATQLKAKRAEVIADLRRAYEAATAST